METPAQRCLRIVAALEELASQEAAAVGREDFSTVQTLHERTAPLVEFLAAAGADVLGSAGLSRRLVAVYELRRRSGEVLAAAMARVRGELDANRLSRARVAQIAPVYGHPGIAASRLQATG